MVEPCLEKAPFEELCGDIVMGSTTPAIRLINPICTEPLDLISISSPLLPTTPSYVHAFHESKVTLDVIIPHLIHIVHT